MSFKNIVEWAKCEEEGRTWSSFFRKSVPPTSTITGQWFDYSTAGGIPVPNYYASSPLISQVLDSEKGIYIPEQTGKRWLKSTTLMSAASTPTAALNQNQPLILLDYLLYYPYVDLDTVGEEQFFTNSTSLPRYENGEGVQIMVVAQAPTTGGGSYIIKYIDSDDNERITGTILCPSAQPFGALCSAIGNIAGVTPFVPLNINVKGVKRIISVTMISANGGLGCFVLVKPFQMSYIKEESRRPTSSPTESYGDVHNIERVMMLGGTEEIKPNAFLGFIGVGVAGSISSSTLVGNIETFWKN